MDAWRKIQIANGACAVVALVPWWRLIISLRWWMLQYWRGV